MRRSVTFPTLTVLFVGMVLHVSGASPGTPDAPPLFSPAHTEEPARYPDEHAWIQRTFPYFRADPDAYLDALDQAQSLKRAFKHAPFGPWRFAGPSNIGGRISDVAFAPSDPATVFAASATGGLFKSTDRGQSWTPVFDRQALLTIGDVAVDPTNPRLVYVGTGEANGGHNNFAGGGVFKTEDGGISWQFLGLQATTSIGRIVIDPEDPGRVFVAAVGSYFAPNPERGLYRSRDGGATWEQVLFVNDSTGVIDVVQRPDDPDVLVAATWQRVRRVTGSFLYGQDSGLWRSRDGGDTWERLGPANGLPDPEAHRDPATGRVRIGRIGLALCRDHPDVMYALYNDGSTYLGLFRTDDGGDTWRDVDPDRDVFNGTGKDGSFSWYFGQVRVHPEDPDRVYVMDVSLMQSTDGGATWTIKSGTHVDHHALAFAPDDPDYIIEGNDGGAAISTDGGNFWVPAGDLPVTQFYEINFDPNNPARLYGGAQDNGTVRTRTGDTAGWEQIFGGDGFYVHVDPTDPNLVYAESQLGNLVRCQLFAPPFFCLPLVFGGIDLSEKTNWDTPVVLDPHDNRVLYYGTIRLYRSLDQGDNWTAISDDLTKNLGYALLGTVTTIAVAPTNENVIYAGTDDGNVWVSDDYGSSWRDITGTLPLRWVTRVVVDPRDERTAYVTFSGLRWRSPTPHVFRTTDMGQTWEDLSANLPDAPVNAFAVDPHFPDTLYLGSDLGGFVSTDAGASWAPLGEGLPAIVVSDLKIDPTNRILMAGTYGRGIYTLDLNGIVTALEEAPVPGERFVLSPNYPDPFSGSTVLPYTLDVPGVVRLEVYDVLGRLVRTMDAGPAPTGSGVFTWDGTDQAGRPVAAGTYLGRLVHETKGGRRSRTGLLTLLRE